MFPTTPPSVDSSPLNNLPSLSVPSDNLDHPRSSGSSDSSDSSDPYRLLCRLRLTFEQIFNNQHHPLDKIRNLVQIWDSPLPPGACRSGIKPLVEFYAYGSETNYFSNVIRESRSSENRTDLFYTVTNQTYVSKKYNDIFDKKDHLIGGQTHFQAWGADLLWDKTKKLWPASYTAVFKRDVLKQVIGYYDDKSSKWVESNDNKLPVVGMKEQNSLLEDYLILDRFRAANMFDYTKKYYVSVAGNQIVKGSDNFYYMLKQMPKDLRNLDLVINHISVFKNRKDAQDFRARAAQNALDVR